MAEREKQWATSVDEPPHDVLAAEEFGMPARDPDLHQAHGPIKVPEDPAGIPEPHDVLAADEFPMPAGRPSGPGGSLVRHADGGWRREAVAAAVVAVVVLLRLLRRP
jgi:hypothetical protein